VIGPLEKAVLPVQPEDLSLIVLRSVSLLQSDDRGTVVLAVIGPGVEVSKVVKTGLGNDRAANMLEFAKLALEYLLEQLESSTKL